MTVNILIQIDKLVQLIESPVFTCKLTYSLLITCVRADSWDKIFAFSF